MRKFTSLAFAIACFAATANAQITKGSFFLGGSVSFATASSEGAPIPTGNPINKNENSQFNLFPQFGIAVGINRVAGIFFGISNGTNEQFSNTTLVSRNTSKGYGGGVFYRRYYPLSQRFYLFGEADLGVGFNKMEGTGYTGIATYLASEQKTTSVSASVTPGISYAAGRKLFLEASLNDLLSITYSSSDRKSFNPNGTAFSDGKEKQFSAAANANGFSGIAIGLRWILPSKKS